MKWIHLLLVGMAIILFSCRQPEKPKEDPKVVEARSQASICIEKMKNCNGDTAIIENTKKELILLGEPAVPEMLEVILDEQAPKWCRLAQMECVERINDRKALPVFIQLLIATNVDVRAKAHSIVRAWSGLNLYYEATAMGSELFDGANRWFRWWDGCKHNFPDSYDVKQIIEQADKRKKEKERRQRLGKE